MISSFVVECLRAGTAACPGFVDDLSAWHEASEIALRLHAAAPFALAVSEAPWFPELPESVRLRTEERLQRERMSLAVLDHELDVSLHALARFPVMVLKGADLSRRMYARRLERPMADVDLLVPYDAFFEALKALGHAGFRVTAPFPAERARVELSRGGPGGGIVELHRGLLAGDTRERLAAIWQRSREGQIPGLPRAVRAMAAEDLIPYLIRHGAVQHLLESPIWLNDVARVLKGSPELRWDRVTAELLARRAAAAGWFVLTMLAEHWNTPVPQEARATLARSVGIARRRALATRLDPNDWFDGAPRTTAWVGRARFLLRDSAWEAIRYAWNRQPAPTELA